MIYVRLAPESGPFSALAFMSAYDPKRTLRGGANFSGRGFEVA